MWAVSLPTCGRADDATEIKKLIDNFWVRSEGQFEFPATIMRMEIDLDGDGQKELLLANSQTAGTSGIDEWFVYTPVGPDRYRYVGSIGMSYLRFRVEAEPVRVLALQCCPYRLVEYAASASGITSRVLDTVDVAGELREMAAWREAKGLRVLAIDSRQLALSDPEWTDLLTKEKVAGVGNMQSLVVE